MSWVRSSKIQHPDAVRSALNFCGEPNGFDLMELYRRAIQAGGEYSRGDLRIAWKVAHDPYYWAAFKRYRSLDTLAKAGFFDDGLEPGVLQERINPHHLTTPLEIIRRKLEQLETDGRIHNRKLVVALTTGCFAPVHDGHLAMMEKAKGALEAAGYEVVGGFMSPSHDDYVSTKGATEEERMISRQLTAAHRIDILNKALADSDWIAADPWESRYAPTDINFTDTIQRLEHYINAHLNTPVPIEIAYVCGADNVQFARAFVEKGLCVVVPRPGYDEAMFALAEKSGLTNNQHVIFAQSSELDISSSKVRQKAAPSTSKLAEDANYLELLKGEPRQAGHGTGTAEAYLLRDDLSWATERWRGKVDPVVLEEAITTFRNGLIRAIENAFERTTAPGYPKKVDVVTLPIAGQFEEARRITDVTPEWTINNDIITGGEHRSIGVSRLFGLSSSQLYSKTLVPRQANQDLKRVLGRLPKGTYKFIDDDISTGSTVRMIEQQLPEGVDLGEKIALSELAFKRQYPDREYAFWDIVDARDFLLGANSGGLVVKLFNGEIGRAPYMLPYTSLVSRAKIPPDQETAFTEEVLNLNRRFFRDVWVDLHLNDTDPQFQALMRQAGFPARTHLSDVCAWHQRYNHG